MRADPTRPLARSGTRAPRRALGILAAGSLAAAAWAAPAAAAPLDPAGAPDIQAAAQYLTGQLDDGTHYDPSGLGADVGVTIDAALALAAAGAADSELAAITAWVAANQGAYTFIGAGPGLEPYISGGEIAKVALLAQATGNDPRAFGGVDLLGELAALICADTQPIGASACDGAGNYAGATSTFKQALGVLAQLRAGEDATAPIAYLASLQNEDGGWPSLIPAAADAPSDVDSTAMAAMAMALVPGDEARAAVAAALAWIAGLQQGNGSFPGTAGESINSAGLAIQALRLDATAYVEQILAAEAFLAAHQNADGGFDLNAETDGSELRASAQALGGAAGVPFGSLLRSLPALGAADGAADWVVAQLVDGNHVGSDWGSGDFGLTADAVFALLAHGGHDATVEAMATWLAQTAAEYADPAGATPDFPGPYGGPVAKLAVVALATGADPRSFGGFDLIDTLTSTICTAADAATGCNAAGEFFQIYSSISQSLGVLALQASAGAEGGLTADSPAVVRLLQLQCPDGGFTSTDLAPGSPCTSEVDATGFAVQALASVPGTDEWLGAAHRYLLAQQSANGLFPGAAGLSSDSTAQAAIALQTLTESLYAPTAPAQAARLLPPIAAWQSALEALPALAVPGGGFGTVDASASDLRSTVQAVQAGSAGTLASLAGAPLLSAPRVAPAGPAPVDPPAAPAPGAPAPSDPPAAAPAATTVELAATGPQHARVLSLWGAVLVLAGAGALAAGRPAAHSAGLHRRR